MNSHYREEKRVDFRRRSILREYMSMMMLESSSLRNESSHDNGYGWRGVVW
jgi:hypothetical protein